MSNTPAKPEPVSETHWEQILANGLREIISHCKPQGNAVAEAAGQIANDTLKLFEKEVREAEPTDAEMENICRTDDNDVDIDGLRASRSPEGCYISAWVWSPYIFCDYHDDQQLSGDSPCPLCEAEDAEEKLQDAVAQATKEEAEFGASG